MEAAAGRRQNIENQVNARLRRGIVSEVPGLVVECPEFSFAHDDSLIASGKRTSLRAPQDQVKAIPDPVIGPGVDMRVNPALRK